MDTFELFDLFESEPSIDLTRNEALITVALCAAASDGDVSDEETTRLIGMGFGHPLFSGVEEHISDIIGKIAHLLNKLGIDTCLELASDALSQPLKETAFLWAVEIVVADGWLDSDEKEFLEDLIKRFKIERDNARKIMEVVKIRYRTE
jgi:tellurite resistance protein